MRKPRCDRVHQICPPGARKSVEPVDFPTSAGACFGYILESHFAITHRYTALSLIPPRYAQSEWGFCPTHQRNPEEEYIPNDDDLAK